MDKIQEKLLNNKKRIEEEIVSLKEQSINSPIIGINKLLNHEKFNDSMSLKRVFQRIIDSKELTEILTDEDREELEFYKDLADEGLALDETQLESIKRITVPIFTSFQNNNSKISLLKEKLERVEKVIKAYESKPELETYDFLIQFFKENNYSLEEQLEMVFSLIGISLNKTNHKSDINENDSINKEDPISFILKKYPKINKDNIIDLDKEGLNNLISVLETLEKRGISKQGEVFKKILSSKSSLTNLALYSKPEYVEHVADICEKYHFELARIINKLSNVLIHKNIDDKSKRVGQYAIFTSNIAFLEQNNPKVIEEIINISPSFITNAYLKNNYLIMQEEYGLYSPYAVAQNSIKRIDQLIEGSPLGYQYIVRNQSFFAKTYEKKSSLLVKYFEQTNNPKKYIRMTPNGNIEMAGKSILSLPLEINGETVVPEKVTEDELEKKLGYIPNRQLIEELSPELLIHYELFKTSLHPENYKMVEKSHYIKQLDELYRSKNEPYVYIIDGTRISRPKVIRICATLLKMGKELTPECIRFALSYDSIITLEDKERIIEAANNFINTKGGPKRWITY